MDEASVLAIVIASLVGSSILLLLHHGYKHRDLRGLDQWFQLSDVGNLRTCSHEMWIICLMAVATILSVYSVLVYGFN